MVHNIANWHIMYNDENIAYFFANYYHWAGL